MVTPAFGSHERELASVAAFGAGLPSVTVRLFAGIAEAAGVRAASLDARTVSDAIALLRASAADPARFERLLERCILVVGDARVRLHHRLRDADELAILPPFSGGAA